MSSLVARESGSIDAVCSHCGQPASVDLITGTKEDHLFCCAGCAVAFDLLQAADLESYYDIRNDSVGAFLPKNFALDLPDFEAFDLDEVKEKHWNVLEDGRIQVALILEGVECAACVWLLERLWKLLPGLLESRLSFVNKRLLVSFDSQQLKLSEIVSCLWKLGYKSHFEEDRILQELALKKKRQDLVQLGVAAVCAANTMLISISLYQGAYSGMDTSYRTFFHWISMLLSYPAVFYSALPFYRAAIAGLRLRAVHMDLPISIGILASFFYSSYATFSFEPEVYFDSVTMLVFLLLAGRFVQNRAVESAELRASEARRILPKRVRVVRSSEEELISQRDLKSGMKVRVLPGETIPCDGRLLTERASLNTAILTGESTPESIEQGDLVYAGSINLEEVLELRVEAINENTRAGQFEKVVGSSIENAPVIFLSDRIASYFLGTILFLSLLSFFYWFDLGVQESLARVIALLIVTCPCALALAVPLALSSAVGGAVRQGILIKNVSALSELAKCSKVYFDKTGTLTLGTLQVVDFTIFAEERSQQDLLAAVAFAEQDMEGHPIASALRDFCNKQRVVLKSDDFTSRSLRAGLGVEFSDKQSRVWKLGSERWLRSVIESSVFARGFITDYQEQGHLTVFLTCEGECVAAFALRDHLRPESRTVTRYLQERGFSIGLLSGDSLAVASYIGKQAGIPSDEIYGELSPEDKVLHIEKEGGVSVMIGDGANDSAAIASADIGIAFNSPVNASIEHADVVISGGSLMSVRALFEGSRNTLALIRSNVLLSLGYNILGITGAFLGVINPLAAAVLMPLSSLTVVGRTLLLVPFRKTRL